MEKYVAYRAGPSLRFTVRVKPEHVQRLAVEAEELGLSRTQVMRGLLRHWVDRKGTRAHLVLTETGRQLVTVRVKQELYERLEERAGAMGLSAGQVLRGVIANWIKRNCDPRLIGETIS